MLEQLVNKLNEYVGKRVVVRYLSGRDTEEAQGPLVEVNPEYIVVDDEEEGKTIIRTPFIVFVRLRRKPLFFEEGDGDEEEGHEPP